MTSTSVRLVTLALSCATIGAVALPGVASASERPHQAVSVHGAGVEKVSSTTATAKSVRGARAARRGSRAAGRWNVRSVAHSVGTQARRPVSDLKIMNYYPSNAAWTAMWTSYDHSRTDSDFSAIAALGANTVRIIVQPSAVGYPVVSPSGAAALRDVVDTAKAHGLSIQLSLFDWWGSFSDVAGSTAWMTSLLAPYAGDPTIALVELRNELPVNDPAALAWARTMLPELSVLLPGVPRTVSGYDASDAMHGMSVVAALPASLLDVVDVHYYGEASEATPLLREAQRLAAGRPVIIGETGHSTADGTAGSDEEQAEYLRVMATIASSLGIPAPAPWTLSDFTSDAIPGSRPNAEEYDFGLRRTDGTWKPAADVVKRMFQGSGVADWDGGFERSAHSGPSFGSWQAFDTADGVATTSTTVHRTGTHSMCFSGTGARATAVPSVEQSLPVVSAGQAFDVSTYVLRQDGTGADRLAIAWYGPDLTYLSTTESPVATAQGTWQQLTVATHAPAGAVTAQVHLKAADETGQACFDDVSVDAYQG